MNKVTTDLSALIAEIKKDPKKYLNVKVSIFYGGGDRWQGTRERGRKRPAGVYPGGGERRGRGAAVCARHGQGDAGVSWARGPVRAASGPREAAERGRQVVNEGRETLATAIERGREAYQQARARENA